MKFSTAFLAVLFVVVMSPILTMAAWQGPTGNVPGGSGEVNAEPPINASAASQAKSGQLMIVTGDLGTSPSFLSPSFFVNKRVKIGTEGALSGNYLLEVTGDVKADAFCFGANDCLTSSSLASSIWKSFANNIYFGANTTGVDGTDRQDRSSRRAGIGYYDPQAKLDVYGNSDSVPVVKIWSPTSTSKPLLDIIGIDAIGPNAEDGTGLHVNTKGTYPLYVEANGADALVVDNNANVGIGKKPANGVKLNVNGVIAIQGGAPGLNKILTSDANGIAEWKALSAIPGGNGVTGVSATAPLVSSGGIAPVIGIATSGCASGQVLKYNGTNWACAADANSGGDITAVKTSAGLKGGRDSGDVTLEVDTGVLQQRVRGTCPAGSSIREIKENGDVTCETDDSWTPSIGAYSGLQITSGDGLALNYACANGQVLKRTSGGWECAADNSGSGTLSGTAGTNVVPKFTGANTLGGTPIYSSNDGNVGIGALSPTYKLDVQRTDYLPDYPARVGGPNGNLWFGPANTGWSHFSTDRPRFYFNKPITVDSGEISSYNGDLYLETNGIKRMTVRSDTGSVGINVAQPSLYTKLNVQTDTYGGNAVFGQNTNDYGTGVRGDGFNGVLGVNSQGGRGVAGYNFGGGSGVSGYGDYGVVGQGKPSTAAGGPGYDFYGLGPRTYFAGKVGIGATDPTQKLDIVGRAKVRSDGSRTSGWWFTGQGGQEEAFFGQLGLSSDDPLGIWHGGAWRFLVDKNGNIGVGTPGLPTVKLDVNGTIKATSLTVNSINLGGTNISNFNQLSDGFWKAGVEGRTESAKPVGFALGVKSDNSWTLYDYTANVWNSGITQRKGKVRIGPLPNNNLLLDTSSRLTVDGDVSLNGGGGIVFSDGTKQTTAARASQWIDNNNSAISYSAGSVGIGTVSPLGKLDVTNTAGNLYGDLVVSTRNAGGVGGKLSIVNLAGGTNAAAVLAFGVDKSDVFSSAGVNQSNAEIRAINMNSVTNATDLRFSNWSGSAEKVNMVITSAGSVGIGTTDPGANKLKVAGGPLEVTGGPIKATGGFVLETRTNDPSGAELVSGRMWLRTDF